MPLTLPPSIVTLPNGEYSVRFQYQWTGDAVNSCSVGGINFQGSQYLLNLLSVQGGSNLPPFRSLQISQSFSTVTGDIDGELDIYVPSSGQLIRVPSQTGAPITGSDWNVVNLGLPLVTSTPLQILFGKWAGGNPAATMLGRLTVAAYTFKLPDYVLSGLIQGQ